MTNLRNEAPIGVFDSGLGGLTVVRALAERLPREDLVYLGDTARTPYGTRSPQTVMNYAHACARVLREQRAKLLVIACNTVSALALDSLAGELFLPVLGVVVPGVRAALERSPRGRVGVLATQGTVRSGAYPRAFAKLRPGAQAFVESAPLLVPLVEDGWLYGDVPRLAVRKYLEPLVAHDIDALLLGCTHYPLLAPLLRAELAALSSKDIPLIDSAHAIADEVAELIDSKHLGTERDDPGKLRIVVTDQGEDFDQTAERFLGRSLNGIPVSAIDL
ncbi:MAG TPA: glutamate racemase [Polyangiales bacterium]|nr:glutamate racemase [Polyangiales bacterium]